MSSSIGEQYKIWWKAIGPTGAGRTQTEEMRRAFYSGAFVMFTMMKGVGAKDLTEEQAMAQLDVWDAELLAFAATLAFMRTPKA